ncbi:hypothetical protein [Rhizobium sp. LCM 4573]|uniref:hypothetical protein n=1 Tax=Rhizobium sp. LCM 4573 TaxID=1848291 RepID=UPI0008DB11E8|nr:hypothetical protein [Rhizobium sp. LCM 4573]OHV78270.1 hypothetical protein LCM4573_26945 [Rhizobium sp. LCM 4573]
MRVEERFNKKSAPLLECVQPHVVHRRGFALGIKVEFYQAGDNCDGRTLSVHLTPQEALKMAEDLIAQSRRALSD